MTNPDEHRRLRELLGSYALGQLDAELTPGLVAHVDGCPACEAELRELRAVAGELSRVDLSHLGVSHEPPSQLRATLVEAVRAEQALVLRRRRRQRVLRGGAAAASVTVLLAGVVATDRSLRDPAPRTPTVPMELVALRSTQPGVTVTRSVVIPHTWGIELQMAATGLSDGMLYRGVVVAKDGRLLPAGEFLGVAGKTVKCNLQAAVLRAAAREFEILDAGGQVVMAAQLT